MSTPVASVGVVEPPKDHGAECSGTWRWIEQAYELPASAGRLRPMEGLRGIAVLMVFFVHFHALFGDYARPAAFLWRPSQFLGIVGNTGVDLFFVLSGYLIYGALIRNRVGVLGFLRRRLARIYPAFLAVFSLYVVLSFVFPQASKLHDHIGTGKVTYIVQNLLLLPGIFNIKPVITPAWSLSYEFFFYTWIALLVRGTRMWAWRRTYRALFFAVLACGYLAFCFSASRSHVRGLMFVVGILLYEALTYKEFGRLLSNRCEIAAIALFLVSIALAYLMDARKDLLSFLPGWSAGSDVAPGIFAYEGPYKTIVLSIGMFWCTAHCFAFDGRLKRFFSWTPLRYLGNMSYSYYLIHGVALQGVALVWTLFLPRSAAGNPFFVADCLPDSQRLGLLRPCYSSWSRSPARFKTPWVSTRAETRIDSSCVKAARAPLS